MRRGIATKILTCIFAFITLVSAGGVFAAWLYTSGAHDAKESAGVLLQEFEWAPEEVLPDDEEDKDNQTSHLVITNELLFNGKIGLIVKSTLNDNVGQKGVLHYVDHVTSGNLDHFQGIIYNSQGGQKLGFALEVIENKMVIRFKILNKYTILCNDKNARLTKILKRIDFLYRQRKIVEKEMLSDRNRVVNIYTKCTRLLRVGRL